MADRISGRALILCAALGTVLWAGLASCALGRTVTHDTGGSVSARLPEFDNWPTPVDPVGGQNPGNGKPVGGAPFDGERGRVPSGRAT